MFAALSPQLGAELNYFERFIGGGALRVGAGVHENLLLYGEFDAFFTSESGDPVAIFDLLAKAQFYPWDNLYLAAGAGFNFGRACIGFTCESTGIGFTTNASLGYEINLGTKFFIAPEFNTAYRRVISNQFFDSPFNFFTITGGVTFGWHVGSSTK